MIEYLGFFYALTKDLKGFLKFEEEEKLVDRNWLRESGLQNEWEKNRA